jgi:hypothetical protein
MSQMHYLLEPSYAELGSGLAPFPELPRRGVPGNSVEPRGGRRPEGLCCSGLLPSLYVIPQARRNVVVAPGRILSISSLVLAMLLLLLLGVVMPRVDAFVRQPSFVLLDVVDDGSKVCATPTGAPGAGGT